MDKSRHCSSSHMQVCLRGSAVAGRIVPAIGQLIMMVIGAGMLGRQCHMRNEKCSDPVPFVGELNP